MTKSQSMDDGNISDSELFFQLEPPSLRLERTMRLKADRTIHLMRVYASLIMHDKRPASHLIGRWPRFRESTMGVLPIFHLPFPCHCHTIRGLPPFTFSVVNHDGRVLNIAGRSLAYHILMRCRSPGQRLCQMRCCCL